MKQNMYFLVCKTTEVSFSEVESWILSAMLMTEAEEIRMIKDVAMHGANYPGNMIPVINKLLTFSYFLYTQLSLLSELMHFVIKV